MVVSCSTSFKAFGVMPSVQSAASGWKSLYPDYSAFLDAASYAQGVPTAPGTATVVTDLDSKLAGLKTLTISSLLAGEQKNMTSALAGN